MHYGIFHNLDQIAERDAHFDVPANGYGRATKVGITTSGRILAAFVSDLEDFERFGKKDHIRGEFLFPEASTVFIESLDARPTDYPAFWLGGPVATFILWAIEQPRFTAVSHGGTYGRITQFPNCIGRHIDSWVRTLDNLSTK